MWRFFFSTSHAGLERSFLPASANVGAPKGGAVFQENGVNGASSASVSVGYSSFPSGSTVARGTFPLLSSASLEWFLFFVSFFLICIVLTNRWDTYGIGLFLRGWAFFALWGSGGDTGFVAGVRTLVVFRPGWEEWAYRGRLLDLGGLPCFVVGTP